jgi:hypothetical protein
MVTSRFSLRTLLLGMVASAVFFAVISQAIRGSGWALGLAFATGALLCILLVHVLFFLAAVMWSVIFRTLAPRRMAAGEGSPFAQDRPPPQWLEPTDPDT